MWNRENQKHQDPYKYKDKYIYIYIYKLFKGFGLSGEFSSSFIGDGWLFLSFEIWGGRFNSGSVLY